MPEPDTTAPVPVTETKPERGLPHCVCEGGPLHRTDFRSTRPLIGWHGGVYRRTNRVEDRDDLEEVIIYAWEPEPNNTPFAHV